MQEKRYIFMKYFYSNSFINQTAFYDQRMELTLSESMQGFSTKDIHIQQKATCIISYIYQKTIVKENCIVIDSRTFFFCYRVKDLVESCVYCAFVKLYLLELYLKTFIRIFYRVIVLYLGEIYLSIYLFIYLFIHVFMYLFI